MILIYIEAGGGGTRFVIVERCRGGLAAGCFVA